MTHRELMNKVKNGEFGFTDAITQDDLVQESELCDFYPRLIYVYTKYMGWNECQRLSSTDKPYMQCWHYWNGYEQEKTFEEFERQWKQCKGDFAF